MSALDGSVAVPLKETGCPMSACSGEAVMPVIAGATLLTTTLVKPVAEPPATPSLTLTFTGRIPLSLKVQFEEFAFCEPVSKALSLSQSKL